MEISPHLENDQAAFLAGKIFCLLSAQPGLHWIVDSGATDHITPHLHLFHSYTTVSRPYSITMPNGQQVQVRHIGSVILSPNITLQGVLHVPEFQYNLLSASKLAKQLSVNVVFSPTACYLQDHLKSKPQILGKEKEGLYLVASTTDKTARCACFGSVTRFSVPELWHCRLEHPSPQHMGKIQGLPCKVLDTICSICPQAKQHRHSFSLSTTVSVKPFELLHVDIWGPYRTPTYDGFKLFLSIVDDFT